MQLFYLICEHDRLNVITPFLLLLPTQGYHYTMSDKYKVNKNYKVKSNQSKNCASLKTRLVWASVRPARTAPGSWLTEQSWDTVCPATAPVPPVLEHRLKIASLALRDTYDFFSCVLHTVLQGKKQTTAWKTPLSLLNATSAVDCIAFSTRLTLHSVLLISFFVKQDTFHL